MARMLSQKGFAVYDTDSEAKRLMISDTDIRRELIELLDQRCILEKTQ